MAVFALGAVGGLSSCSGGGATPDPAAAEESETPAESKPEEPEAPMVVLGEVAAVYERDGFVLIRKYGGGALPTGYSLMAVSETGSSVNLSPTGERIGRFHAADIEGETPAAGDRVVGRRLPDSGVQMSPETVANGSN